MDLTRQIEGLIFDKDGTLFGFQETWSRWARELIAGFSDGDAGRARALEDILLFDPVAGRFLPQSPVIAETTEHVARLLEAELTGWSLAGIIDRMDGLAADMPQAEVCPLVPLFDRLRGAGLALGVATNDSIAPARANLAQAGLAGHFDFVVGADSGFGAKPEPGQLLAFARQFGIPPDRIVMIGDSLHDLEAARRAGMIGLGVLSGAASRDDLAPHAADVLGTIAELPDWLNLST